MSVSTEDIAKAIRTVLANAATGTGEDPAFLFGYQIIERLPAALRDELEAAYGPAGRGAGQYYTIASRIAPVARELSDVEVQHVDAKGLAFDQQAREGGSTRGGNRVVAIYRLKR